MTLKSVATFGVRRRSVSVDALTGLGHGGKLVMDGLTRDELEHRRNVDWKVDRWRNLAYWWVTQHHHGCPAAAAAVACSSRSGVESLPSLDPFGGAEGSWRLVFRLAVLLPFFRCVLSQACALIAVTVHNLASRWLLVPRQGCCNGPSCA